jgi:hypothetical protein
MDGFLFGFRLLLDGKPNLGDRLLVDFWSTFGRLLVLFSVFGRRINKAK